MLKRINWLRSALRVRSMCGAKEYCNDDLPWDGCFRPENKLDKCAEVTSAPAALDIPVNNKCM